MVMEIVATAAMTLIGIVTSIIGFFLRQTIGTLQTLAKDVSSLTVTLTKLVTGNERDIKEISDINDGIDMLEGRVTNTEHDIIKIKAAHKAAHQEII